MLEIAGTREFALNQRSSAFLEHTSNDGGFPLIFCCRTRSRHGVFRVLGMFKIFVIAMIVIGGLINPLPAPEILAVPVPNLEQRVERGFEGQPYFRARGHRGIDIQVAAEEVLRSPFSGAVSFRGKVFNRDVITVRSSSGLLASFEPACGILDVGDAVSAGAEIGSWCEPEETYQEHCEGCVHFSVRSPRGYLNPLLFLGKVRASRLVA